MSLTHSQKIAVYLDIDQVKRDIKTNYHNGNRTKTVRLINRKLDLERLLEDSITISRFISNLPTEKAKDKYLKLLSNK